jgi:RNA polymerase sigma-70 factor (ECF subfamily)
MVGDQLLLYRFKQGNHEALRRIYDKYKVMLLRLAIVLIGDQSTAEDIVHDVFIKFAQSSERIKMTGSLKNYLVTSVINRVRNILRDDHRHGEAPLEEAALLPSSERGPEQWAVLSEQLSRLSRALQHLPWEQREVICFHMEMDMPLRRIAVLQGISVNTVKGRYRYAMKKLRSLLNSEVDP